MAWLLTLSYFFTNELRLFAGLFLVSRVTGLLLCKQAAKIFQTICKKETALKRVLSNLLSAVSLLRFKAVFSCGFRVPPGSGLYQSCAAGSVCIPAGQKYCSPRPRKSCPADRKTPAPTSHCKGLRWWTDGFRSAGQVLRVSICALRGFEIGDSLSSQMPL